MVFVQKSTSLIEIVHDNGIVLGAIVSMGDGHYYLAERERNFWNSSALRTIADELDRLNGEKK